MAALRQDVVNTAEAPAIVAARTKRSHCEQSLESEPLRRRQRLASTSSDASDDTAGNPTELHIYIERLHVALEHCLVEGLCAEEAMNNLAAEGWHPGAVSVVWARLESENPDFFACYNERQLVSQRREVALQRARQIKLSRDLQTSYEVHYGTDDSDDESDSCSCSGSVLP